MSGAVVVLHDRPAEFVVACFNADCPEHGIAAGGIAPWVDEFTTRKEAEAVAREHRSFIRSYWAPDCPTCGQRVKATTHPADERPAK